ncbi:MAG: cupredoxin domain-containing protein [Patescibacteria group bacterium]
MTRKQATIIAVFGVVVLVGVAVGVLTKKNGGGPVSPGSQTGEAKIATSTPKSGEKTGFTNEIPKNAELTKPSQDIPITSKSSGSNVSNYKVFNVNVSASGYNPSEIVANKGDVVEINLTASGGSFDIFSRSAGFYVSASDGKIGKITFTPSDSGTYDFSCRDSCPNGKIISGKLIILP